MSKNTKGIIAVLVVAAVAGGAWYFTHQNASTYAKQIIKYNGSSQSYAWLVTLDKMFLRSWAKGIAKGKKEFVYQNERYNTQGGKKLV